MVAHNEVGVPVFKPLDREEFTKKALELRIRGWSYNKIADDLGVSSALVYQTVSKEIRKRAIETAENADELLDIEVQRLDALYAAHAELAQAGSMEHTDICLKIAKRRADLLGLDAAKRHIHEVKDETRSLDDARLYEKVRALKSRLAALGHPEHPVLLERNPFEPPIEGEVLSEPVKVVARTVNPAQNSEELGENVVKAVNFEEKPENSGQNGPESPKNGEKPCVSE